MASAETSATFNCTTEQFYKIISDYEKYGDFLTEIKQCRVLRVEGQRKLVEYTVSVIKTFSYRLWMTEEPNKKISWVLDSGDFFKTSNGFWELKEEGGKTLAKYGVDATFNMFVPGPIAKTLVQVNLPGMIAAYHRRVKELYGN